MNSLGHILVAIILIACIIFLYSGVWFIVGSNSAIRGRAEMCERFQVIDLLDKTYTCVENK